MCVGDFSCTLLPYWFLLSGCSPLLCVTHSAAYFWPEPKPLHYNNHSRFSISGLVSAGILGKAAPKISSSQPSVLFKLHRVVLLALIVFGPSPSLQLGSPQQKPKRLRVLADVSGSMYRFNGVDGRLERSMEAVCMVMEALESYEHKFKVTTLSKEETEMWHRKVLHSL